MKNILLMLMCVLLAHTASAQTFEYTYEGLTLKYSIIDSEAKTCEVASNRDTSGDVVIPASVKYGEDSYTVVKISDRAFNWCDELTSLAIPENVNIGKQAFYGCSRLTSLTIPENVSIEHSAFRDCSGLTSLTIPENASIGLCAFWGCTGLTSLTIPENVSIGDSAFEDCSGLTSLTISENVTIGESAFRGCSGLTSLTIPENETIGGDAFRDCSGLTALTVLENVTIENSAFRDCSGLTSLTISKNASIGSCAFWGCIGLTSLTIPENTTIAGSAFCECTGLTSLTLSENVAIDSYAFSHCSELKSLVILNNVTIAIWAFKDCIALTSLTIPENASIDSHAFYECNCNLEELVYNFGGEDNRYIGYLLDNKTLKKVVIGEAVKKIPNLNGQPLEEIYFNAICADANSEQGAPFSGMQASVLVIGNTVERIPDYFFYGFKGEPSIPPSVKSFGRYAFSNSGITSIDVLPTSITEISEGLFANCAGLTEVVLPSTIKSIGNAAFKDCRNIATVDIPNSVTEIGYEAFSGCGNIGSMKIGAGVTKIESNQCQPAKVIWQGNTPPDGYQNLSGRNNYTSNNSYDFGWGQSMKVYPFLSSLFETDGIVYVPVSMTERTCDIIDGSYTERARNIVLKNETSYRGVKMSVSEIMPFAFYNNDFIESLEIEYTGSVPEHSFYSCDNLSASLTLPEFIENIGENAFRGCKSLEKVECRNSGYIGNNAFNSCENLETAIIENGGYIGNNAFDSCSALKEINIRSHGTVGSCAFRNCNSASNLIIAPSITSIDSYAFEGCSSLSDVTIEEFVVDSTPDNDGEEAEDESVLKLSSNGSDPLFVDCPLDEVFIGRKLEYGTSSSDGYSPFYRNLSLRSIVITDEETEIYDNEFYGCSNLESVRIGDGVKSFGNYAFSGCSKIKSFEFGRAVETIGDEAFSDCTAMTALVSHSATPPTCGTEALDDINKWECTLHVPSYAIDIYAFAPQWNSFFFVEGDADIEKYFEYEGLIFHVTDLVNQLCEVASPENMPANKRSASSIEDSDTATSTVNIPHHVTFNEKEYTVNGIGENAFSNQTALSEVVIPSSVSYVGKGAFSGCDNLSKLVLLGTTPPDAKAETFDEAHYNTIALEYPEESHSDYQAHRVWGKFTNVSTWVNDLLMSETYEVARYDATGKQVDKDYRGVVIIHYSDGRSVKCVVK